MNLALMAIALVILGVGFNMTEEQIQEWNLVPVCSAINKSQIFIEGLNEQCAQIYGGPVE